MSEPFDADTHVRHMAELMALTIREEWMASVIGNMAATQQAAAFVAEFELDDHTEPATVFEA